VPLFWLQNENTVSYIRNVMM